MGYRDNATPSDIVSGTLGVETITLSDSKGRGSNQECREVLIWPESGKSIKIGEDEAAASTGPVLIPDNKKYLTLPVSNTNLLYFGGTTGDKVYLRWRS